MSFKTLKVTEECLSNLVSCGTLYLDGSLYDLAAIMEILKNQTTTLFDESILSGPVVADDVSITSPTGTLETAYLNCINLYPTTGGTIITIDSPFLNSYVPNANSKNSLTCTNFHLDKTTLPYLFTLATIFRNISNFSSSFMISVGKYANYDSTLLNMYYDTSSSSKNYASLVRGSSSVAVFCYNTSIQFNKILHLISETTSLPMIIPHRYNSPTYKLSNDSGSNGNLAYYTEYRGYTNEITMSLCRQILKIGGALYLRAGNTSSTVDSIEYYSGVIWNSTYPDDEDDTGTPLYKFEDPQGSVVASAAYPWTVRSNRGPLIFISKDGDLINHTTRALDSGTLKMFKMGVDEDDKEWWSIRFIGHSNSYTMGANRPPIVHSVGVIRTFAGHRLMNFRFHTDLNFQSTTTDTDMLVEKGSTWSFQVA